MSRRVELIRLTPSQSETTQGHRLFQSRVGPARFERRLTIRKRREFVVGRRDETPLVSPDILSSHIKALALETARDSDLRGLIWLTA